jgi:hypothetical protein
MRAAKVEEHDVGLFARAEAAEIVIATHRLRGTEGRHVEDIACLPEVVDCAFLQPSGGERPPHGLDHVAMHVVGRERNGRARPAQRGCDRQIPAGHIDLGRVRDRDAGATRAGNVVLGHDQAMSRDELLIQKPGILHDFGRRHAVAAAYLLDLGAALREMGHHAHAHAPALVIHVAQEIAGAGVDCMRREHDARAAIERPLPALRQIERITQGAFPDRGLVFPGPFVHAREIDIVQPGRR